MSACNEVFNRSVAEKPSEKHRNEYKDQDRRHGVHSVEKDKKGIYIFMAFGMCDPVVNIIRKALDITSVCIFGTYIKTREIIAFREDNKINIKFNLGDIQRSYYQKNKERPYLKAPDQSVEISGQYLFHSIRETPFSSSRQDLQL